MNLRVNRCTVLLESEALIRTVNACAIWNLRNKAGDDVLFVLNPGPHRKVSHSSISAISEEAFQKAGTPLEHHQVGDCEVLVYQVEDDLRASKSLKRTEPETAPATK